MEQDTRPETPMLQYGLERQAQLVPPSEQKLEGERSGLLNVMTPGSIPSRENAVDKRMKRRGLRAQILCAASCFLLTAGCGFPIGFSAILLPQLRKNESVVPTSLEMESWIASVHSAATPLGALISSWMSEQIGRRASLQVCVAPFVLGWVLLTLANSYAVILVGRIICGIAVGISAAPCQVYLGEVTEPHVRGMVAGTPMVAYSLGILIVYSLGSKLEWHMVAGLSMLAPLLALVALSCMPESPVWLARKGKVEAARKALTWLRGATHSTSPVVEGELRRILSNARGILLSSDGEGSTENHNNSQNDNQTVKKSGINTGVQNGVQSGNQNGAQTSNRRQGLCSAFRDPGVYKPFIIVNMFNAMQIFSGTFLVIFYAVDIMRDSSESLDEYSAAVLTAGIRLAFALVACLLLFYVGRRPMALASGLLSGAAALALGFALHLKETGVGTPSTVHAYGVIACLLLYIALNTCGFLVLPIVAIGELLPARVRGLAGGYIFFSFNALLFGATKVFPLFAEKVGVSGVFWFFGCFSMFGTLLAYLLMPETRGATLDKVEEYFAGDNFLWITRDRRRTDSPLA